MLNSTYSSTRIDEIMSLIDKKYNGDITRYAEAEKEVNNKILLRTRLNNLNSVLNSDKSIFKEYEGTTKHTYVNLVDNIAYIAETPASTDLNAILSYSYDYLTVKRIFPYSLNTFLNKSREKDRPHYKTATQQDEAYRLFQWVKDRVLNTQFTLNSLSLNKSSGVLSYRTITRDVNYGATTQYIDAVIDPNKIVDISGTEAKGKILALSQHSDVLLSYFLMFGFTEFYARCTCPEYYRKYGRKRGMANYFCSHLLYSMAQLPYYAMYYLG